MQQTSTSAIRTQAFPFLSFRGLLFTTSTTPAARTSTRSLVLDVSHYTTTTFYLHPSTFTIPPTPLNCVQDISREIPKAGACKLSSFLRRNRDSYWSLYWRAVLNDRAGNHKLLFVMYKRARHSNFSQGRDISLFLLFS